MYASGNKENNKENIVFNGVCGWVDREGRSFGITLIERGFI